MAVELLDGGSGQAAVAIDLDGATTVSASVAGDCLFRSFTVDQTCAPITYLTFCSASGHVDNRSGAKDTTWSMAGYVGKGNTYSQPGSLFALTSSSTLTFTYATGCSVVIVPMVTRDQNSLVAYGETARVVEGKARAIPTWTWVTS